MAVGTRGKLAQMTSQKSVRALLEMRANAVLTARNIKFAVDSYLLTEALSYRNLSLPVPASPC